MCNENRGSTELVAEVNALYQCIRFVVVFSLQQSILVLESSVVGCSSVERVAAVSILPETSGSL